MTVRIQSLQPGGSGGSANTSFSDAFTRANANTWGTDWIISRNTGAATDTGVILNNQGVLSHNATTAGNFIMFPARVSGLFTRNQFAQATFITSNSTAGVTVRSGPGVLFSGDPLSGPLRGYYISIRPETLLWDITSLGVGQLGVATAFVFGDIFRLSVSVQTGQNVLTILQNGVLAQTITDVNAVRPLFGLPTMFSAVAAGATRTATFDDFSCGVA